MSYISVTPGGEDPALQLRRLAREIVSDLSDLDPAYSKELLGGFVSDLFLSVAEQVRREDRRQRQAQGIAAAKARGVRFGRSAHPLPDNFNEVYQQWLTGTLPAQEAASACGMTKSAFYYAARRRTQSLEHV